MPTQLAHAAVRSRTGRVRFSDLLRSEWIKFTSLPSLLLGLLFIAGVTGGLPVLIGLTLDYRDPQPANIPESVYQIVGLPASLAIAGAGVLGVIVSGSEFTTRTMQATLLSVPRRTPALLAKVVLTFALTTIVSALGTLGGWAWSYPPFDRFNLQIDLTTPGVALAMIGAVVSAGLVAACGVGFGLIVRSTTVGAVLMIVLTFGSLLLVQLIPVAMVHNIASTFLLGMAAGRMAEISPAAPFLDIDAGQVNTPAAWLVVIGWALITLIVSAVLLKRRDV